MRLCRYLISLGLSFLLIACSSSSSSSTNYNTVSVSGSINLTGTLSTSTAPDLTNYMIWAQNRASKRVYFADLDENGDFTLPLEVAESTNLGDNFIFCLIQKDPLTFAGTIMKTATENANSGFEIGDDVSNFDIDFDLTHHGALLSSVPAGVDIDDDMLVRLNDDDEPVGANNAGKGTDSKTNSLNSSNTIDKDQDGVPDIFDAMNNGADLDNTNLDNSYESAVYSDALESIIMFMNLKVDQEQESTYTVTENAVVVIEVRARSASSIDTIEADLMHDSFKDSTLDKAPDGYTVITSGGHTENSTWLQSGTYPLYEMENLSNDTVWTVLLKPGNNDFNPGSLVRIKVTLTDGSIEYYFTAINFKFSTIPDHTTTGFISGTGSRNDPYVVPATGNVTLTWTAPEDENGDDLEDLEYSLEFFYYDGSDNSIGQRSVQDVGTDTLTATIPDTTIDQYNSESPAPAYMQVDMTCRYPYGDNSANKIYIKRSDW